MDVVDDRLVSMMPSDRVEAFAAVVADVEPRLRRALVAAYGPVDGREAAADALAWAWEHLERLDAVSNRAGYLWRVAQSSVRRQRRRAGRFDLTAPGEVATAAVGSDVSPSAWDADLVAALQRLSMRQRTAVVLVDAYGYQLAEAAAVLDCSVSTLRNHLARGRASLRDRLGGEHQ